MIENFTNFQSVLDFPVNYDGIYQFYDLTIKYELICNRWSEDGL